METSSGAAWSAFSARSDTFRSPSEKARLAAGLFPFLAQVTVQKVALAVTRKVLPRPVSMADPPGGVLSAGV